MDNVPVINVGEFSDTFVIQFGTKATSINAYTLASSLVAIADAAKAANASVNPGYDIEIIVEAVGPGSFKTTVRAVYNGTRNLFSAENLKAIVISIIATYIYTHTLEPEKQMSVTINTDEVIVHQGDKSIVVPRSVHEATKQAEQSPEFRSGVARLFEVAENDSQIRYLAITPTIADATAEQRIPRERFATIAESALRELEGTREFIETTDLQITRAILERGRKRWQFVWRGIRISAPVLDNRFYDRFFAHEITIAPGDVLNVRLRVRQHLEPDTQVYLNDANGYEIVEVLEHRPRAKQARLLHDN